MDIACIRTNPVAEMGSRAKNHTKTCALMGHCVESGYGLVNTQGEVVLLDDEATPKIVAVLQQINAEDEIWLQVDRQEKKGKMNTIKVEEAKAPV